MFFAFFYSLASPSVAYKPSRDVCYGEQLKSKCTDSGQRVARINNKTSLEKVKAVIGNNDLHWTGLRWDRLTICIKNIKRLRYVPHVLFRIVTIKDTLYKIKESRDFFPTKLQGP